MISLETLAAKYGMYILGTLVLIGVLGYLHHSIYQDGYNDAKTKYEARDTKATSEALGILAESKRIADNNYDRDKVDYENRIEALNSRLAASDTSSVPVRTQRPQACREGKTNDTKGDGATVGESGLAELAEYNRGLIKQTGAKINAMARELLVCSQKVREAYVVR